MKRLLIESLTVALGIALPATILANVQTARSYAAPSSPKPMPEYIKYPKAHGVVLHLSQGPGSVYQKEENEIRSGKLKRPRIAEDAGPTG